MLGTLFLMLVLSTAVCAPASINGTYNETSYLNETASLNTSNIVKMTNNGTRQPMIDVYSEAEPRQLPMHLLSTPIMHNVAFSVRKAAQSLGLRNRIQFQEVVTNVGGGWDETTSEFVAPYNGGYFFIFHAVGARDGDFTMALNKNGEYQVTAYGTQKTFEHGSNSIFLQLRRQDKIFLQLQQGFIFESPGNEAYTTFNGFSVFRA
nr:complement C1q-like protein 4 isoform X1 [Procambarus clarkii]